jgi:alpha-amylase
LSTFNLFDVGANQSYFNDLLNEKILKRVAYQSYLPTNALLLKLVKTYPQLKIAFSISGITLEAFEEYVPEVIESFRALADTGSVEFLSETYYHSLSCLRESDEFETQVLAHAEKIYEHFGVRPGVFRNTELIYNNHLGKRISNLGFRGVFTDGIERILNGRSEHHIYNHPDVGDLKIFMRNYRLSDEIAFRFTKKDLTVGKFLSFIDAMPKDDRLINLALDYETFGEHKKADTGIFKFLEELMVTLAHHDNYKMMLPGEAINILSPHDTLDVTDYISWADTERDLSAWLGNDMQRDAFDSLMALEHDVKFIDDPTLLKQWRYLQSSDHFYYMSTKKSNDGVMHTYFSHYPSCYEAFINFMNVYTDFSQVVKARLELAEQDKQSTSALEAERRKLSTPVWAMSLAAQGYHH